MSDPNISIRNLTKQFGPFVAVNDISFDVGRGEVLGFLGPNGAGKSTTMRMLTCFITPTSGTATVCGFDILTQSRQVRSRIGYLPEGAPAYPNMTPKGFLNFIARMRGLSKADRRKRIADVVEMVQLSGVMNQPFETLSKGFKRRVSLAQAFLHDPDVLILDEPTDGLDPNQKHEIRGLIKQMAEKKVIVVSTHILEEVSAVCTRAIIINRGKIVADGTPLELEQRSTLHNAVRLTVKQREADTARRIIQQQDGVASVESAVDGDDAVTLTVFPKGGEVILPVINDIVRRESWHIVSIYSEHGSLEDVFRALTIGAESDSGVPGATGETGGNITAADDAEKPADNSRYDGSGQSAADDAGQTSSEHAAGEPEKEADENRQGTEPAVDASQDSGNGVGTLASSDDAKPGTGDSVSTGDASERSGTESAPPPVE